MILSHSHRFIFIKTLKSAGTSIEAALSAPCGPSDVIAPFGADEARLNRSPGPQNYITDSDARPLRKDGLSDPDKDRDFYNHMPLSRVAALVGGDVVNSYRKCAFVRNPWDKQVSLFFFLKARGETEHATFHSWLRDRQPRTDLQMLTIGGEVAIDFVGRYETLQADYERMCSEIGIEPVPLPLLKAGTRPSKEYRRFYNDAMRDKVARACAKEIDLFGYAF